MFACGGSSDGLSAINTSPTTNPTTGAAHANPGKAAWTYMVYIAGENDLSSMATLDLEEMAHASSSDTVNVPVMMERNPSTDPLAPATAQRGIVKGGQVQLVDLGQNLVFSDKATLTAFIQWAKAHYPAERYALVLWSHGSGWKSPSVNRSALYDNNGGRGYTSMSVPDMAAAVRDAGGVDLVNFDACLMGMYEVAYEFRDVAQVLVGSEENIPGTGNPYDTVLNRLVAQPQQDAYALGRGIVADFDTHYRSRQQDPTQLAAIDLRHMPQVHQKLQETATLLSEHLDVARIGIEQARDTAPRYDDKANKDLVRFAQALTEQSDIPTTLKAKAQELVQTSQAAVLANRVWSASPASTNFDDSAGLAIYLPDTRQTSASERRSYHTALTANAETHLVPGGTSWSAFVDQLITGIRTRRAASAQTTTPETHP